MKHLKLAQYLASRRRQPRERRPFTIESVIARPVSQPRSINESAHKLTSR